MIPHFKGIVDSTLREGEQTPGVHFTRQQRQAVIEHLHRVGVEEIELGIASEKNGYLVDLVALSRQVTRGKQRLALWCRCLEDDIAFAARCRPDVLSLSIPASELHIRERLRKDRAWILHTLEKAIRQARRLGIGTVSVGFEDATRAEPEFLVRLARRAERAGAERLRIADTVGIASPSEISGCICRLRKTTTLQLGIHSHNDFGMATANAIAAVDAGASWLDATVLGLGERAGNCRLEEAVAFLALQRDVERYQLEMLLPLSREVCKAAKLTIGERQPVIGKKIFTCETGLHLHGLTVNPATYEPYAPHRVGAGRRLCFGRKTGKRALCNHLARLGHPVDDSRGEELAARIRNSPQFMHQGLSDAALIEMVTT